MNYVLVRFAQTGDAYQEADPTGNVTRYLDADGNELFTSPPAEECQVIDTTPTTMPWMI